MAAITSLDQFNEAITSLDQFNEALDQAGITSLEGRFQAFKALADGKDVEVRTPTARYRYSAAQFAADNPWGKPRG